MEKAEFDVLLPVFRNACYNITDFGAVCDGYTDNKNAIEAAIEKCHTEGGGKVIIPQGLWLTGPIELKSNVNLHLESGAVLSFSDNFKDYPLINTNFEGFFMYRCKSPIYGKELENIAITGKGIVNGNGKKWRPVKHFKMSETVWRQIVNEGGAVDNSGKEEIWWPSEINKEANKAFLENPKLYTDKDICAKYHSFLRPALVNFTRCKKILLDGPTFQNSPAWCIHPWLCTDITVRNISVRNPWFAQNGDGLDVDCCKNVRISDSVFDVGDDAICMKSGKNEDGRKLGVSTENVLITDCVVYSGHGGFVAGSEMSGGLKNIFVENCTFIGTDIGLRFKSCLGRGGVVENIYCKNINMSAIKGAAISFDMGYDMDTKEGQEITPEEIPEFKNIYIDNINCSGSKKPILISGLKAMPLHHIYLSNMILRSPEDITINNAENIFQKNINVIKNNVQLEL